MPSPSKSKRPTRSKRAKRKIEAAELQRAEDSENDSNFGAGVGYYQAGQFVKAAEALQAVLQKNPTDGNSWHVLGLSLHGLGQSNGAVSCLEHAIEFCPRDPEILSNAAAVLRTVGMLDRARALLEQVVAMNPDYVAALTNLGSVLLDQNELESAEKQLEHAVQLAPDSMLAGMNLANVWMRQERIVDAERHYRKLSQRHPNNLDLRTNWAESLRKLSRCEEAIAVLAPDSQAKVHHLAASITAGRCLIELGRFEDATNVLESARQAFPDSAQVYHYLGHVELSRGDLPAAESLLTRAAELAPDDGYICSRLAVTLLELNKRPQATEVLRRAVELNPNDATSHSFLMFLLSGDESVDPQSLFESHLEWGRRFGRVEATNIWQQDAKRDFSETRRLRIGYISPDFCNHAVSLFFEPVLASHDSSAVETFCYSESNKSDAVTQRLKLAADHWRETRGQSSRQVAQQVVKDKIDILVDLAGHTANNRLLVFPHRPAPIQMTWLGYPNTTGLACVDYRLTCETQNPAEEPSFHSEQLIRMPSGSFCFSPPKFAGSSGPLPAERNGFVTFGSLHRPIKIGPRTYDLWAAVLTKLPTSKLLLYNTRFTAETKCQALTELVSRGVGAERVTIRDDDPENDFLEAYRDIDIALDVTPWAGATTTLGALWMGVPVVAFDGGRRSARSTVAIVSAIGHADWAAKTKAEYVKVVESLSSDRERLSEIRTGLREQLKETVLDAKRFTRELENEFRRAWRSFVAEQNG